MSHNIRKQVFGVSDQVLHKPACTVSEDGYRLEILDIRSDICIVGEVNTKRLILHDS